MPVVATEYIAPRYAERFRCVGADCEETCCAGWDVVVDGEHYAKLEHRMRASPEEEREFRAGFAITEPAELGKEKRALIVLHDGSCHFLGSDRLCSLQKRYGSEVLSDTCAVYPRQITLVGQRVELTAKASCPEVARRLLLAPDACEIGRISPAILERRSVHHSVAQGAEDPYESAFDEVRTAMVQLVRDAQFPLASRLAFLGCLADSLSPFFYREIEHLDEARLARAIAGLESAKARRELHAEFSSIVVPEATAASLVLRLLGSRMQPGAGSLGRLVTGIFSDPAAAVDPLAPVRSLDPRRAEQLLLEYKQAKGRWEPDFGARIDSYMTNYSLNHLMQEPFTTAQNVAAYAQNLFLRVAALRFLLFSHPDIAGGEVGTTSEGLAASGALLDRVAVEVVYKFTRGVEHNADFKRRIELDLDEKVATFERAMFLLKF